MLKLRKGTNAYILLEYMQKTEIKTINVKEAAIILSTSHYKHDNMYSRQAAIKALHVLRFHGLVKLKELGKRGGEHSSIWELTEEE